MADCRGCGRPIAAKPGYESRTFYCSRQCEDRAYRQRRKLDAEGWREENRILVAAVESLNNKLRGALAEVAQLRTTVAGSATPTGDDDE